MGFGYAFGTGFVQKTQQRRDEDKAAAAEERLRQRQLEDWQYKLGEQEQVQIRAEERKLSAEERLRQRQLEDWQYKLGEQERVQIRVEDRAAAAEEKLRQRQLEDWQYKLGEQERVQIRAEERKLSVEEQKKAERKVEAQRLFGNTFSGKKYYLAVNDYANNPTVAYSDIHTKYSNLREWDGGLITNDQFKINQAVRDFDVKVTGTPYEGSPYAKDIKMMLNQGDSYLDIMKFYRPEADANGVYHLAPKATAADWKSFELKGLRTAGDNVLFNPKILAASNGKIKSIKHTMQDGTVINSYAGEDVFTNEYIANFRTLAREIYNNSKQRKVQMSYEQAAVEARQFMSDRYGPVETYSARRQANSPDAPPMGVTQAAPGVGGAMPITEEQVNNIIATLYTKNVNDIIREHDDLGALGNSVRQAAKTHPQYAEQLKPIMANIVKAMKEGPQVMTEDRLPVSGAFPNKPKETLSID